MVKSQGRRYPLRERRAPRRFLDEEHVLLTYKGEPETFDEAKEDTHKRKWLSAMQDEMDSLHENHTYELVELPKGKKALRNKWVYKLKLGDTGKTLRYKARIVVKGFQQKKRVDFDEIFDGNTIRFAPSATTETSVQMHKIGMCLRTAQQNVNAQDVNLENPNMGKTAATHGLQDVTMRVIQRWGTKKTIS